MPAMIYSSLYIYSSYLEKTTFEVAATWFALSGSLSSTVVAGEQFYMESIITKHTCQNFTSNASSLASLWPLKFVFSPPTLKPLNFPHGFLPNALGHSSLRYLWVCGRIYCSLRLFRLSRFSMMLSHLLQDFLILEALPNMLFGCHTFLCFCLHCYAPRIPFMEKNMFEIKQKHAIKCL